MLVQELIFNVPYDFDVDFLRYQPYNVFNNIKICDETSFDDSTDIITINSHGFESYDSVLFENITTGNISSLGQGTIFQR